MASRFGRLACGVVVTGLAWLTGGCLQKGEVRSVIHLDPTGSMVWSILEADIRSAADTAEERRANEAAFLDSAAGPDYPPASALRQLGASEATTRVLKANAPFEVHTLARFDRLDDVFGRLFTAAGFECSSQIERHGSQTTWTLTVFPGERASEKWVGALVDAVEHLRIVLTNGRFVGAVGFTVSGDREASLDSIDVEPPHDGQPTVILSLTWESTDAR